MATSSSKDDFATTGQPSAAFVQQVRGLQVITIVMAIGASVIAGIAMLAQSNAKAGQPEILAFIGIAVALANLTAHAIVPKIIASQQLGKISREDLLALTTEERQQKAINLIRGPHITGSALLEGAAVINAIAYLIDNWIGSIAIAGVLVVLIVLRTPSVFGMYNKVAETLQQIEDS